MTAEATTATAVQTSASAEQALLQLLVGMWTTQAVATAARLGIPDLLASGPSQTAEEIASTIGAHPRSVRRLMRTLASIGVFTPAGGARYTLTPIGERLCSDRPGSLKQMFIAETDTVHWQSWAQMLEAVRTGEPRPQAVFGMPVFEYYAQHASEGEQFGRAMADVSQFATQAVLDSYDFSGIDTIVDVGGGNGSMLLAILERYPHARGIVFDLPYIGRQSTERIRAAGMGDRCRFEPGDFFEGVPDGADLVLLKFVLHDWNDEDAVRVLRSCRAALAPEGRLLVVEMLLPEENRPDFVQFMDLNMLVMTGGLERTASEYGELFDRAGFRLSRVVGTKSPFHLIEGTPL